VLAEGVIFGAGLGFVNAEAELEEALVVLVEVETLELELEVVDLLPGEVETLGLLEEVDCDLLEVHALLEVESLGPGLGVDRVEFGQVQMVVVVEHVSFGQIARLLELFLGLLLEDLVLEDVLCHRELIAVVLLDCLAHLFLLVVGQSHEFAQDLEGLLLDLVRTHEVLIELLGQVVFVPGVLLDLLNRDAFVLDGVQHARDQVLDLGAEVFGELLVGGLDLLEDLLVVLLVEGQAPAEHGLEDDADAPHVALHARLRHVLHDLRRSLVGAPATGAQDLPFLHLI